ncbi:MAG: TerB family tellurite resistance protein [Planctomycetes bacterium]|nr:TerB family tellurite resistance protein [Planctomycetota bacterium]
MPIPTPPAAIAHVGLRALKTVAAADGEFQALERELLESLQTYLLHTEFDLEALEPITAEELAEAVPEGEFRERIVHGAIMMTLIDGEAAEVEMELVDGFARALGVDDASLKDMHRFANGQFKIIRLDLMRRFIAADRLKKEWNEKGVRGIWNLASVAIRGGDAALAAKYQALEQLPEGTLGREYFEFVRRSGFALPGEKGAGPELIVFHDCNHVLGDYGTSAEEETQVAAFHAGYRGHDKFGVVLFLLMQFHLGVQITPTTGGVKGFVKPDLVLKALERGAQVNVDLITEWDPIADFEVPVAELRERFNILPR